MEPLSSCCTMRQACTGPSSAAATAAAARAAAASAAAAGGGGGGGGDASPLRSRRGARDATAAAAAADAVETLPPAVVAARVRALVARLPPDFVRREAVELLETLPSGDLVDAAVGLVDAAPEALLRSLAGRLLDTAAASRRRAPDSTASGITTLETLSVATVAVDAGALRLAAATLLRGARPDKLAARVGQLLAATPSDVLRDGVLRALDAAATKGQRYDSLGAMLASDDAALATDDDGGARADAAAARLRNGAEAPPRPSLAANLKRLFLDAKREPKGDSPAPADEASTLEGLVAAAVAELSPDVVLALVLDTLAALPPDAYESLSRLLVAFRAREPSAAGPRIFARRGVFGTRRREGAAEVWFPRRSRAPGTASWWRGCRRPPRGV